MTDPFQEPAVAAEMRAVVGVRYVCATLNCDWWGYAFHPDELCPKCGRMPIDRWVEHAKRVMAEDGI